MKINNSRILPDLQYLNFHDFRSGRYLRTWAIGSNILHTTDEDRVALFKKATKPELLSPTSDALHLITTLEVTICKHWSGLKQLSLSHKFHLQTRWQRLSVAT